jgi:hypothetical protein
MFTESAGANQYRALADRPALARSLGWQLEHDDEGALLLSRSGDVNLVLIPGRQIVTAERLEVLALACSRDVPDGRPIRDVLREVVDLDAIAVIPWGFGKWIGPRGRIVRELIDRRDTPFCLGDNGGRAMTLRRPALFDYAERRSMPVLAGSDPLPMPHQVDRPGSYGFILDRWSTTAHPTNAIKRGLRALTQSPPAFGELSSVTAMIRSQIGLRWRPGLRQVHAQ